MGARTAGGTRSGRAWLAAGATLLATMVAVAGAPPAEAAEGTMRVSVSTSGIQGDANSTSSATSGDGRYVAFQSNATNLVSNDTNGEVDVFVRDTQTDQTARISVDSSGAQGAEGGQSPSISQDGQVVAFSSWSGDLVAGDTNATADVFVHDRGTGSTSRVSVASGGAQANGASQSPAVSADGSVVAFQSYASNLVAGDTNGVADIFVHDLDTGLTTRVSVGEGGTQGNAESSGPRHPPRPSLSADGRYVAFASKATNMVPGDTNAREDVFVHDRGTSTTTRVSLAPGGGQGDDRSGWPSMSASGRYVAFESQASNLVASDTNGTWDVYVHDRDTGTTERASVRSDEAQANHASTSPSLSADGARVAFTSFASNLVTGDTNSTHDVFLRDMPAGTTMRVSVAHDGSQASNASEDPALSADASRTVFHSTATNLVPDDTNASQDTFVTDNPTKVAAPAGSADVRMAKSADTKSTAVGQLVEFTLAVTNAGPASAQDVRATDSLPAGLVFSASPDGCTEDGGVVDCPFGALVAGETATRRIVVAATGVGEVINTATASTSTTDPNAANDTDAATLTVVAPDGVTDRIFGVSRVETAVAASQDTYGDGGAGAVVLARADTFPDALAGAPLAVANQAPLLLTETAALHPATAVELQRVLPAGGTVHLLGGSAALSPAVEDAVADLGYEVVRYPGADRYATAVLISQALGDPGAIFVATGRNFPDALAAGAAAAELGGVIVLTDDDVMVASTADYIADHADVDRYAIGGPSAGADPQATPVVGADRYATALQVATTFFEDPAVVGVAVGTNFPDALAGDTHIARRRAPMLLVDRGVLPGSVADYLTANRTSIRQVFVYGGEVAISPDVETAIAEVLR